MRVIDIFDAIAKVDFPFRFKSLLGFIDKAIEGAIRIDDPTEFGVDEILDARCGVDLKEVEVRHKGLRDRLKPKEALDVIDIESEGVLVPFAEQGMREGLTYFADQGLEILFFEGSSPL